MNSRGVLVIGFGGLLLAACASNGVVPPPMLAVTAENCAAKPDLTLAQPLILADKPGDEKPVATSFDAQSPCYESSPGVKSYYRIFQMPAGTVSYTVSVASTPFGQGVFAPDVALLDGNGNKLREIARQNFVFRGSDLTTLFRNHPEERYLLVWSDPDGLGKTFELTKEATQVYTGSTGFSTYQIHTGTDTTSQYIYTANGNVTITLVPIPAPDPKKS